MYVHDRLSPHYPTEVVPGVTSVSAAIVATADSRMLYVFMTISETRKRVLGMMRSRTTARAPFVSGGRGSGMSSGCAVTGACRTSALPARPKQRSAKQHFERRPITAAAVDLRAVLEENDEVAIEQWLDFANPGDADDRRA